MKSKICNKLKNEVGKRYDKLIVISRSHKTDSSGNVYWNCICDCGNKIVSSGCNLRTHMVKSCRSCSNRGWHGKRSIEFRRNIGIQNIGKKLSQEHVRKLSESHKGQKHSLENKRNISKSLKDFYSKNEHHMKGKKLTEETKKKIKAIRIFQKFPFKDTSIEIKMQKFLRDKNIPIKTHIPIVGQPDIFIEPNICIFCDGDYWHRRPKQIIRDEFVNAELQKLNYTILRFWEKDINKNIEKCWGEIKKILNVE